MDCEVLIIGGGPAGLSAATVLGRCLRNVVLYDAGEPRNRASHAMHCFVTRDGINPAEFLAIARAEMSKYQTVRMHKGKATSAKPMPGGFEVTFDGGAMQRCRKLLLATGVRDILPPLEGADSFYGRSIHHCPYCDGWEHRGEVIAVYGSGDKGAGLAKLMSQWSADVVLCSNGCSLDAAITTDLNRFAIKQRTERVSRLEGHDGQLRRIHFDAGPPLECSSLFFNTGQYQRSALLEQLGCRFDKKGGVETNEREETCVPGVYVAGDASRDLQFVVMAAAEGARAAVAINTALLQDTSFRS